MARVLLDTDVIIWFLRGRGDARRWMQEAAHDDLPLCSALSATEVIVGMRPQEEKATRALLGAMKVVPVDAAIAWRAGELLVSQARKGTTMDLIDATIAATCLLGRFTLATYNVRHYPIPELRIASRPT